MPARNRARRIWETIQSTSPKHSFTPLANWAGPPPQEWTVHRWRYADTEPPFEEGCAWRPEIGLWLCGDWLNGGKVEGTWLSGRVPAERVLRSFAPC